tara:strand:- start:1067 stop:2056 length:990 start_codon:yes stop_codon:yes gene_type:complete
MNNYLPKISHTIDQKNIHWCLKENYNSLSIDWFIIVGKWMFNSYSVFKDHEKYLILIYLVKKTFDYYAIKFVRLSWDQFFALKKIEVGKFSIIDVAKELKISKETTRRKIEELKRDNIIKKTKSGILFQTTFFNNEFNQNNKDFLKLVCSFVSKFSAVLVENKVLKEKIQSQLIEKSVIENFSSSWKIFFEMQIPLMIEWKFFFGDLETWHIWETSLINQNYEIQKYLKLKNFKIRNKKDFFEIHSKFMNKVGINAMSISDITGIPRATVIRKLKKLINSKYLDVNNKKLYYINIKNYKQISINKLNALNIQKLSIFLNKILNLTIISK